MAHDDLVTPVNLIHDGMEDCKIQVKVFIQWTQSYKNNPTQVSSMEMIFIDSEGNKICDSVKKFLIPDFEELLKEGNYLVLTNFGLQKYGGDYKLINHNWKINFYRSTKVRRCAPFEIATDGFNPVCYDDVLEWRIDKSVSFDVVGILTSMQELRVKRENEKETKSIEFVLQDVKGKRISCALWAEHATQLYDYVSNCKSRSDPIILLIHNVKLKEWRRMPQVSNQLFGCRVYINEDINPINIFKAELEAQSNDESSQTHMPIINVETVVKTALDFYTKPPAKTVEEVRTTTEVTGCVVKATVIRVSSHDGWFTYGCKACGKKAGHIIVNATGERIFECDMCGIVKDVYSKIRSVIRVQDNTGSTSFVLFDTQLSKMINRSVSWLNAKKENSADPHVIPEEFDVLLNKEFVFSIRVSDFNLKFNYSAYTVDSVTEDVEVVKAIHAKLDTKLSNVSISELIESTPNSKGVVNHNVETSCSFDEDWTPDTVSLKRKSESPPDVAGCETSTSKAVRGIALLKIPRMEDI